MSKDYEMIKLYPSTFKTLKQIKDRASKRKGKKVTWQETMKIIEKMISTEMKRIAVDALSNN